MPSAPPAGTLLLDCLSLSAILPSAPIIIIVVYGSILPPYLLIPNHTRQPCPYTPTFKHTKKYFINKISQLTMISIKKVDKICFFFWKNIDRL